MRLGRRGALVRQATGSPGHGRVCTPVCLAATRTRRNANRPSFDKSRIRTPFSIQLIVTRSIPSTKEITHAIPLQSPGPCSNQRSFLPGSRGADSNRGRSSRCRASARNGSAAEAGRVSAAGRASGARRRHPPVQGRERADPSGLRQGRPGGVAACGPSPRDRRRPTRNVGSHERRSDHRRRPGARRAQVADRSGRPGPQDPDPRDGRRDGAGSAGIVRHTPHALIAATRSSQSARRRVGAFAKAAIAPASSPPP
ncbi:hypothetical protein APY03_5981 [Variovorax sp. WDL1]|nr:hypothetical protein APY03_5981 [Variovorax sp. WDL1]